jgi:hypothetical protein
MQWGTDCCTRIEHMEAFRAVCLCLGLCRGGCFSGPGLREGCGEVVPGQKRALTAPLGQYIPSVTHGNLSRWPLSLHRPVRDDEASRGARVAGRARGSGWRAGPKERSARRGKGRANLSDVSPLSQNLLTRGTCIPSDRAPNPSLRSTPPGSSFPVPPRLGRGWCRRRRSSLARTRRTTPDPRRETPLGTGSHSPCRPGQSAAVWDMMRASGREQDRAGCPVLRQRICTKGARNVSDIKPARCAARKPVAFRAAGWSS